MPQNLQGRRFGHNLLIRAYALTLPLLGFKCTWYEIKPRDMNEKGKDVISYNKPYMCFHYAFMVHCTWLGCVHSVCPCFCPSVVYACTHTLALPAAAWAEGWRGACIQIYSSYSL